MASTFTLYLPGGMPWRSGPGTVKVPSAWASAEYVVARDAAAASGVKLITNTPFWPSWNGWPPRTILPWGWTVLAEHPQASTRQAATKPPERTLRMGETLP